MITSLSLGCGVEERLVEGVRGGGGPNFKKTFLDIFIEFSNL